MPHQIVWLSNQLTSHIDPDWHTCGSVTRHGETELRHPEPGVYLIGAKSYGRAPTFLLATGYEQVRAVVAALDERLTHEREIRVDSAKPQPAAA